MKRLTSTLNLSYEEWLKYRKLGIGGSDAGAICGLNPYLTAMQVYHDKNSDAVNDADNEAMRQGRDLEDYVAQRFMEATGKKVRKSNAIFYNEEHPFMLANVDRLVIGEDAGLECKTASAYGADKWADGKIPLHYIAQCLHYMAVTGKRAWYIACVILGREFTYRKLIWDDALIERLIEAERGFWNNYVTPGILPSPDGSDGCDRLLNGYFKDTKKEGVIELTGFDERLERRERILAEIERLQTEQRQIEQEIKLCMKENEAAINGNYRISWSSVDTTRLDAKRIKRERPDVYADYAKTVSTRRFTVKAA